MLIALEKPEPGRYRIRRNLFQRRDDYRLQVLNAQELMFGNAFINNYPMSGTANAFAISGGSIAAKDACKSLL